MESVVEYQRRGWQHLERITSGEGLITDRGLIPHNVIMSYGYVLGRVAFGHRALRILDWGGGLGYYSLLTGALLPSLETEYHCRDLPLMVEAGRLVNPSVVFHSTDEEALGDRYDLVIASGAVQYIQDWRTLIESLAKACRGHVYIARLPLVERNASFVASQNSVVSGYGTEYPGWIFNKSSFLSAAGAAGLTLRREFITGEEHEVPGTKEPVTYRSFLFEVTHH